MRKFMGLLRKNVISNKFKKGRKKSEESIKNMLYLQKISKL